MNRQQAHQALEALLDAVEKAASANDPVAQAQAEEAVVAGLRTLMVETRVSMAFIRRFGGAMRGPTPLEPPSAGVADIKLAREPATSQTLKDRKLVAAYRRGAAQTLEDIDFMLPPGLALFFAAGLLQLNGGNAQWPLFKPYTTQGIRGATSVLLLRDFAHLSRIYYDAEWCGKSLPATAKDAFGHEVDRWDTLEEARRVNRWTPHLNKERERARRDKAESRYTPPHEHYDHAMLEKLKTKLGGDP